MEETISSCLHKCAARNTRNTVLQTTVNSEALQAPFTPVECINTDKDTSLSSELSRELIRYIFIKRILFSSGVAARLIFSSISQPFRLGIFLGFYFFVNRANCVFVFFFLDISSDRMFCKRKFISIRCSFNSTKLSIHQQHVRIHTMN